MINRKSWITRSIAGLITRAVALVGAISVFLVGPSDAPFDFIQIAIGAENSSKCAVYSEIIGEIRDMTEAVLEFQSKRNKKETEFVVSLG